MLILLPIFVFLQIYFLVYKKTDSRALEWRIVFLVSCTILGLVVYLLTEILSFFDLITFRNVVISWMIILSVLTLICAFLLKRTGLKINIRRHRLSKSEISLVLILILLVILPTFMTALISPPNNYDSMGYHMSRVVHWVHNHNINYYPTHDLRCHIYPPWAEYAIMHSFVLSQNDRFVNLLQWFSFIGIMAGISLLASLLGASRREQILSVVFSATLPMAILQSSSTQNDLVVTFWLICFINFIILLIRHKSHLFIIYCGISLGLAMLSKATAYIYAFPFFIWLCFLLCKNWRERFIKTVFIVVGITLLINGNSYLRNIKLMDHPLRLHQINNNKEIIIKEVSVPLWISNFVRNIGLHVVLPMKEPAESMESFIIQLHRYLGVDASDPRSTYDVDFHIGGYSFHEDYAGNPLHFSLIILCIIWLGFLKERDKGPLLYPYLAVWIMAVLFFTSTMRWTPWSSRYHLPLFVMFAPLAGIVLSNFRLRILRITLIFLLIGCSFFWVFLNRTRPLLRKQNIFNTKRNDIYFFATPGFKSSYVNAVNFLHLQQCYEVGLVNFEEKWEYPLWIFLDKLTSKKIRIEAINVNNDSNKFTMESFLPCAVLSPSQEGQEGILYNDCHYRKVKKFRVLDVYMAPGI